MFHAFIKNGSLATAVLRVLAAGVFLLAAPIWADDAASVANKVKAGFLFHFVRYLEWPSQCFSSKNAPIVVCIIGKDPIAADIKEALSGQMVESRPLSVRQITDEADKGECHVLYICASEKKRLDKILEAQKSRKVFTVSDLEHFEEEGGMIALRRDGQNIRFRINQKQAEKAGLKVSSKLLQLSK